MEEKWKQSKCPSYVMAYLYFRKLANNWKEWGQICADPEKYPDRHIAE